MSNNSKIKIIAVAFAVILVGGAGFFVWRGNFLSDKNNKIFSFVSSIGDNQLPAENEPKAVFSEEFNNFKSAKYNFSFEYPKGFSAAEFIEWETTDIILVQNSETRRGFQVAVSPFDGPDLITPGNILKDIPDMQINEPKNTISNGIRALEFLSDDGGAPKAEIWFINKGYLYQISAFKKDKDLIEKVLSSWKF